MMIIIIVSTKNKLTIPFISRRLLLLSISISISIYLSIYVFMCIIWEWFDEIYMIMMNIVAIKQDLDLIFFLFISLFDEVDEKGHQTWPLGAPPLNWWHKMVYGKQQQNWDGNSQFFNCGSIVNCCVGLLAMPLERLLCLCLFSRLFNHMSEIFQQE